MRIWSIALVVLALSACGKMTYTDDCEYWRRLVDAHEWCLSQTSCRVTQEERYYYIKYKTNLVKYKCHEVQASTQD